MSKWEIKTLDSVAIFRGGGTPSKENPSFWGGDIPWVSPKDMKSREVDSSIDTINLDAVKNSSASLIPKGSILIVVRSGILARTIPVALTTRELTVNQDIKALCPLELIDARYLLYYLESQEPSILQLVTRGATVHRLQSESLKALKIPVPPLPEQKQIVSILDNAFEGIDRAIAHTQKNLNNAHELFESYLNAVFTQQGNGWSEKKLEDVCESIIDCINKTAPVINESSPFKMIRTTNVRNGRVNLDSVRYVSEETYRQWTRRQTPKQGDVLLTREAPMGEVGMLLADDHVFLGQRIVSYRTNPDKLNNKFLLYALQSRGLQDQIKKFASGSTVQHMRVPDTKILRIAMPSISTQKQIVEKFDALLNQTQLLETIYQRKLTVLTELKQSILQKAFTGELTADSANQATKSAEEEVAA